MITLTLAGAWQVALAVFFSLLCLFLCMVILIQKPKGGGLSGAFGGGGGSSSQAVFGAKTGDVLTWVTIGAFVLFIMAGISLVWTTRDAANGSGEDEIAPPPTPVAPVTPTAPSTPVTPAAPTEPTTPAPTTPTAPPPTP